MALTDENGMNTTMLVSPAGNIGGYPYPVYTGGNNSGNNGFGGDNGWWIVLLIILLAAGGWNGNNNGNNGGGVFGGGVPYVVNNDSGAIQRGFDQSAIMSGINGIQNGVSNLSTQLCNCCADMSQTVNSGFANAETAANARQIANMQQAFNAQTATMQGFNALGTQFADCCCENRLGIANLNSTILSENCADRAALAEGVQSIINNQTAGVQRILDVMCSDKIDAKNEKIADLERQLTMANLAASQTAQTAALRASQNDVIDGLYNRLATCPVGTMPVYGNQPIFTCPQNQNACGCGCGSF